MRLVIVGCVFLGALAALIWFGIDTIPVLKVGEVLAGGHTGPCRIDDGVIHSIEHPGGPLEFTIRSDASPGALLAVETKLSPPDNFKIGYKVSVRGTYDPAGKKFHAEELMTKCPSRYEASKTPAEGGEPGAPPVAKVP